MNQRTHLSHAGALLHAPLLYDLQIWCATRGRVAAYRARLLRLAHLQPGEAVLDVGCGTGGLALAAKRVVGPDGRVAGIDASQDMLARARGKARRAHLDVAFTQAPAQALPFPDACFDVVLSTIMMHHLPRRARQQCLAEIKRVLKPGGRVLVIEFAQSGRQRRGLFARLHKDGHVKLPDVQAMLAEAELSVTASGLLDKNELTDADELLFALATL